MNGRNDYLPSPECVVKVGEGRGFIISYRANVPQPPKELPELKGFQAPKFIEDRLVVTAAHCLPEWPPPCSASYRQERTSQLLGRLGNSANDVWAECLFADPVADIAVLGCPDDQAFGDEADAYHSLV